MSTIAVMRSLLSGQPVRLGGLAGLIDRNATTGKDSPVSGAAIQRSFTVIDDPVSGAAIQRSFAVMDDPISGAASRGLLP
jgi:hypothetical protein